MKKDGEILFVEIDDDDDDECEESVDHLTGKQFPSRLTEPACQSFVELEIKISAGSCPAPGCFPLAR